MAITRFTQHLSLQRDQNTLTSGAYFPKHSVGLITPSCVCRIAGMRWGVHNTDHPDSPRKEGSCRECVCISGLSSPLSLLVQLVSPLDKEVLSYLQNPRRRGDFFGDFWRLFNATSPSASLPPHLYIQTEGTCLLRSLSLEPRSLGLSALEGLGDERERKRGPETLQTDVGPGFSPLLQCPGVVNPRCPSTPQSQCGPTRMTCPPGACLCGSRRACGYCGQLRSVQSSRTREAGGESGESKHPCRCLEMSCVSLGTC